MVASLLRRAARTPEAGHELVKQNSIRYASTSWLSCDTNVPMIDHILNKLALTKHAITSNNPTTPVLETYSAHRRVL